MLKKNNLLVVTVVFLTSILMFHFLEAKITSNIMKELKRSYVPGPYDPGYDPNKINPENF